MEKATKKTPVKAKAVKVEVKKTVSTPVLAYGPIYKEAWAYAKKNVGKFAWLLVLIAIINLLNSGFENTHPIVWIVQGASTWLSFLLSLASAWLSMGLINVALRLFDNKEVSLWDGIIGRTKTWKSFVAGLIRKVFVVIPCIPLFATVFMMNEAPKTPLETIVLVVCLLLLIPAILLQVRLNFGTTLILDQDLGVWESIKTSRTMTKGSVRKLIVIGLVTGIVQVLGILTLGIGLFRTIPFMVLAQTLAYRALRK